MNQRCQDAILPLCIDTVTGHCIAASAMPTQRKNNGKVRQDPAKHSAQKRRQIFVSQDERKLQQTAGNFMSMMGLTKTGCRQMWRCALQVGEGGTGAGAWIQPRISKMPARQPGMRLPLSIILNAVKRQYSHPSLQSTGSTCGQLPPQWGCSLA